MSIRLDVVLHGIDVLRSGGDLDIVGEPGSGRSHVLGEICAHLEAQRWSVLRVPGIAAFRAVPFAALGWLGEHPRTPAVALEMLRAALGDGPSLVAVDDADDLDDASRGVLARLRDVSGASLAGTRRVSSPGRAGALSGFARTFQLRLSPLRFEELERLIVTRFGFALDGPTMSSVYAKSNGNVGIALALVEAAVRDGRIRVDGDTAGGAGEIWTPAMTSIAEALIARLDDEERAGLETLAILGPAAMSTALRLVDRPVLERLGDAGVIEVFPTGDRHIVTVRHPILVDHFRHRPRRVRSVLMADDIVRRLASGTTAPAAAAVGEEHAALFVTLVHEHARRRLLAAQDAWSRDRTKGTAAELIATLRAGGGTPETVAGLFAESADLPGSEQSELEWENMYGLHLTTVENRPGFAVARLRARAEGSDAMRGHLLAWAALIEQSFIGPADPDALPEETTGMAAGARGQILRSRAFVQLMRGDLDEADRLISEARLELKEDQFTEVMTAVLLLARGEFDHVEDLARRGYEEARAAFHAADMYAYTYIAALEAFVAGRYDDAEDLITEVAHLHLAAGEPQLYRLGLAAVATLIAETRGTTPQGILRVGPEGFSFRGPFPGMATDWIVASRLRARGSAEEAADVLIRLGDEQWAMGLRLPAAYAYLIAADADPAPARSARLSERVSVVQGHAIQVHREIIRARVEQDLDALEAGAERLEALGQDMRAVVVWRELASAHGARGDDDAAARANAQATRITSAPGRFDSAAQVMPPTLTEREREVARLVAVGMSNREIADLLVVTVRTVESHVSHAMRKCGVASRHELRDLARGLRLRQ
ncbi:helix-turn-helix transcriptional regulator [Microbacterium sp. No. 7]|uniref:helix-turn-helix transcriptional regulator n=1 Tax=Microbacterium sp. No. 7 TaxID=1714373 RepID=UPI0006D1440D|nr:LuxR family transcriptional regulator [Microbacterium sp. No. 7]ALJ19208.1 hypothetical protein AOA12_04545 [Microbacterium sp. No. 7]